MDPVNPLAPIFAASVVVQQILEVVSTYVDKDKALESKKKPVLAVIGFVIGIVLARSFGLDVMQYFDLNSGIPGMDTIVTAMVLSAGTEGTNSIVKFLKYLKEDKKATAAETLQALREGVGERATTSPARATLESLRRREGRSAPRERGPAPESIAAVQTPALNFISGK